jgi:hypothetical protein
LLQSEVSLQTTAPLIGIRPQNLILDKAEINGGDAT